MKRSRSKVISLAAVALAVVAAAALASSSRATSPGRNGRIAYMLKDQAGHWQIWLANSDLSGAKRLTRGYYDSGWAVWSPDGTRLAFDSDRTDHTPSNSRHVNDVFVMKPNGASVKKLTDSRGSSADAAWSPNGRTIAFDSDRGKYPALQGIYLMDANGRHLRRVTKLPAGDANDLAPRFSPDGKRLVFTRYHGRRRSEKAALFTVRLDGGNLHRLTSYAIHAGDADWSPNGKRIVFEAYPNPASYGDVYVIDATGGSAVNLTQNPVGQAGSADPTWSPDGSKILFLDNRVVNGVGRTGLATMNPDGSDLQFISSKNVEAHQADWESIH